MAVLTKKLYGARASKISTFFIVGEKFLFEFIQECDTVPTLRVSTGKPR